MSKILTNHELRNLLQNLDRGQLEEYLLKVVRQLEKYQAEELTEEKKIFLEALLKKAEEERALAAEIGQALLKKNERLTNELKSLRINIKEIDRLNSIIINYEKEKENWEKEKINIKEQASKNNTESKNLQSQNALLDQQIGTAGTENKKLKDQIKELQKKIEEQRKEINDSNELVKGNKKEISELINDLERERELWKTDNIKWKKKEEKEVQLTEDKFKELEWQHNELIKDNENLSNQILSLEGRIQNLGQEKEELQREIEHNEQKDSQIENPNSTRGRLSLGEEMKGPIFHEVEEFEQKAVKLKEQLLKEEAKNKELEKKLISAETKFNNIQQQNIILNNQLTEVKIQLTEVQVEKIENYWEEETNKKTQEKVIQKLTKETKKLEREKTQSKLADINKSKKIETLQRKIDENIALINSLHKSFRQTEIDWQQKVSAINDGLHQTQGRLENLVGERDETKQTLQQQKAQTVSQHQEDELNEQISQMQDELAAVNEKLKEVETDRNNNHRTILNHHQEKMQELEKERDELLQKYQTLTALHDKTTQELARLEKELIKTQNLGSTLQENLTDSYKKLEKEFKNKEQDLAKLHEELITLQNQLNAANDTIEQQNQRIGQKNQELTKLTNQLTDKDQLITDLQTEIANLKTPPTFGVNSVTNKDNSKKSTTIYSQEDLEKLIKKHQQEVRELKDLIANNAEQSHEIKLVQEVPVKEVIQQLPKKNNSSFWLCLLGYSLGAIILGLKLLKKLKSKKKQ